MVSNIFVRHLSDGVLQCLTVSNGVRRLCKHLSDDFVRHVSYTGVNTKLLDTCLTKLGVLQSYRTCVLQRCVHTSLRHVSYKVIGNMSYEVVRHRRTRVSVTTL